MAYEAITACFVVLLTFVFSAQASLAMYHSNSSMALATIELPHTASNCNTSCRTWSDTTGVTSFQQVCAHVGRQDLCLLFLPQAADSHMTHTAGKDVFGSAPPDFAEPESLGFGQAVLRSSFSSHAERSSCSEYRSVKTATQYVAQRDIVYRAKPTPNPACLSIGPNSHPNLYPTQ